MGTAPAGRDPAAAPARFQLHRPTPWRRRANPAAAAKSGCLALARHPGTQRRRHPAV